MSSCGSLTLTPNLANDSCASFSANAVCTQAFVGTHPTRRQVPPSSGSFSMQTAFEHEALEDPRMLELLEALRQRLRRDADDRALELVEADRAAVRGVDDREHPAAP